MQELRFRSDSTTYSNVMAERAGRSTRMALDLEKGVVGDDISKLEEWTEVDETEFAPASEDDIL